MPQDPRLLASQSNEILTAIVQGMRKEEQSNKVKLAATKALLNSLEFTKANFEKEVCPPTHFSLSLSPLPFSPPLPPRNLHHSLSSSPSLSPLSPPLSLSPVSVPLSSSLSLLPSLDPIFAFLSFA